MLAETVVSEFQTQQVTVGATPAQIVLQGSLKCFHGVLVKALKANTVIVYVGNDARVGISGFALSPGDEVFIAIDLPEKIWGVAASDQTLCLLLM